MLPKIAFLILCTSVIAISSQNPTNKPWESKEALYPNPIAAALNTIAQNPYTIVCYMENIGMYNRQADMIIRSMENYFHLGYAFSANAKIKKMPVIFLYKVNATPRKLNTICFLQQDSSAEIYNELVYKDKTKDYKFDHTFLDGSATLFVLDNQKNLVYQLDHFHSYGEELRPFEKKMQELAGDPIQNHFVKVDTAKYSALHDGSIAPDFILPDGKKLSEITQTKKVILSFYPAPFTGYGLNYETVPYDSTEKQVKTILIDDKLPTLKVQLKREVEFSGGCGGQARYIDNGFSQNDRVGTQKMVNMDTNIVYYYISSGNENMLRSWDQYLKTRKLNYLNDTFFRISQMYGSYNYETGLNYRSIFVIDNNRRILLTNYDMESFYNMKYAIKKALGEVPSEDEYYEDVIEIEQDREDIIKR